MRKIVGLLVLLGCPFTVSAGVIQFVDSGWYDNAGGHDAFNLNYIVGRDYDSFVSRDFSYKNFFVFDLTGVGKISSATLSLDSGFTTNDGVFTLLGVEIDVDTLRTGGEGRTDIYDEIDSGVEFGQVELLLTEPNELIHISLNDAAIASINSGMGQWAIGGVFDYSGEFGFAFGGSGDIEPVLMFTPSEVPIPATVWLFASALLGLARGARIASTPPSVGCLAKFSRLPPE